MTVVAVTDACIFIDICDIDLFPEFFNLPLEIHTTIDVINELYAEQQRKLDQFIMSQRLIVHNLKESDKRTIEGTHYPRALSEADKSALHLAAQLQAMLLSSDNAVRKAAHKINMRCHGILWVFDQMVESGTISKADAINKLLALTKKNQMFVNNQKLDIEIQSRIDEWSIK